jgi:hypothetical protein
MRTLCCWILVCFALAICTHAARDLDVSLCKVAARHAGVGRARRRRRTLRVRLALSP